MRITALIYVACVLGLSLAFEDKTVVQWLAENGGFNTLVTAVQTAGLTQDLSSTGPFTIFAPTDDAFNKLGSNTVNGLLQNPSQLSAILKYHVVNEFVLVPMISADTKKDTLDGQQIDIKPGNGGLLINDVARVSSSNNDIIVNNGVIQPIDVILMPTPLATFSIGQVIVQDSRFTDLNLLLLLSGLLPTLESGDFTLFAPVNTAFSRFENNLLDPTDPKNTAFIQEVLKYHVVPGGRTASQLSDGQTLYTIHGTPLTVSINTSGVQINKNATVIDADIQCTNGIIHAIDAVLAPRDLFQSRKISS